MSLRTGLPLLLDHPLLAVPAPETLAIGPAVPSGRPVRRLSRRERLAVAAQVLALASLLQEVELHVGAAPVRNMLVLRDERGVRAVLRAWPRPVDGLAARLGGAEMAVRGCRDGLVEALATGLGMDLPVDPADRRIEWLTFEPWLEAVLAELRPPLPARVARSLWALRLDPLPEPAGGEITYWSMPRESLAHRLAAVLAVTVRSGGGRVFWYRGSLPEESTAPLPVVGDPGGVLILSGALVLKDILAAERWVEEGTDRSSVVVGRFPGGWAPPVPPVLGGSPPESHLLVTGIPRDRARLEAERWAERLRRPDAPGGEALTRSAAWLFAEGPPETGMGGDTDELLRRCLGLAPEGVPEGLLSAQTGLAGETLASRVAALGAELEGGLWRWPTPQPVRRDPLHLQVAALFPGDNPRRLLHGYLGDPSRPELLDWARQRLRAMEPGEVRSILGLADPDALSGELLACRVESALSDLDLATARPLVEGLPEEVRSSYRAWLAAVDGPVVRVNELLPDLDPRAVPVAVGEVALRMLERAVQRGAGDAGRWTELARRAALSAGGPVGARLRLEAELLVDAEVVLKDRAWRREALSGPERLRRVLLRRVANLWKDEGREELARRLLLRVLRREDRPGFRGLSELDLGYIALNRGRNVEADRHHLRAMQLLQAAGFRWRTRVPAFNLGVAELDRLQVERALRRLREGAEEGWDPFFEAEMARLDLARGHEASFLERLSGLRERVATPDRSLSAPLSLLEGVAALLRHDLDSARSALLRGGEEAGGWLAVIEALQGLEVRQGRDGWGLFLAAGCLQAVRHGRPEAARKTLCQGGATLQEGFALALCERLLGRQGWADGDLRRRVARTLGDGGLDGWRKVVAPGVPGGAVSALATRILESGTVPRPEHRSWGGVLEELGLDGLEVRSRHGGPPLLRVGHGEAGEETPGGSTVLVPLGSEAPPGPAWNLLAVVLSLTLAGSGQETPAKPGGTGFVGRSPASRALRAELERLAPSSVPVVLVGETGVGKEVAARMLHELSGRRGPFVPVNMAALPPQLVETELFGSVRGAFTGADRSRKGLVAAADGGTLFLDEIGEMDMALQAKLLRFLESSEVRPVGSEALHRVDVRVISATNSDLERAMTEGCFRTDLYFRIATAVIRILPLRERPGDIADLVEHFTAAAVARHGLAPARWSPEALGVLSRHSWPGNARELRNIVEMALIAARGGIVGPSHLPVPVRDGGGGMHRQGHGLAERPQSWEEAHRRLRRGLIEDALHRNGGNRSAAARDLGITRQTLLYHMKFLGVE